MASGL